MPPANTFQPQSPCPCGSPHLLADCCLPYLQLQKFAPTAEALMRSRYSAHVLLAIDYLWETWSPEQRIRSSKQDIQAWASACDWLKLEILSTEAGLETDQDGIVSFVAFYRHQGRLEQHHETSRFKRILERWVYVDHIGN